MLTTKFLVVVLVGLYFLLFLFVYIVRVLSKCGLQLVMVPLFSVFVVVELVLCYCGPSTNPETHMLRAIQQPATEKKQARHRFDILHSGSVGAQPRPQPTISGFRKKKERGPTLHPHHIITHNTQHQILNVYNKTTIIRRGSLHGETSAMFVTTCGPFGNSFSPLKR
jgi:hypothetical protein